MTTQWDGAGYLQFENIVGARPDYDRLAKLHRNAWAALWRQSATLALPDEALERIWYRSVFWTLCTCGSEHFLPGEAMFSEGSWAVRPFTYGAAGWAVQALAAAGFPERARAMLNWHFAPDALRQNAEFYTGKLCGKAASPDAWSFAHEVKADGNHNPCDFWELQRHWTDLPRRYSIDSTGFIRIVRTMRTRCIPCSAAQPHPGKGWPAGTSSPVNSFCRR